MHSCLLTASSANLGPWWWAAWLQLSVGLFWDFGGKRPHIALRWRFVFVIGLFDDVGHVLGLRVGGGPCGASLASCGRLCWLPRDMALMFTGVEELHEATKRPHYASQAEATPRVDVGEVSQASGDNAARSIKDRNPCTKGGSNKRCFFVIDLSRQDVDYDYFSELLRFLS